MTIRAVKESDAQPLTELLNYYVQNTTATFHTGAFTIESRREWVKGRTARHPAFVLEDDGVILGVCGLNEFRSRKGYAFTVESMVYLRNGYQGRGLGRKLMEYLVAEARRQGHHAIIAVICAEQPECVRLHEKLGFEQVAHLRQVGRKFDRWLDSIYMQLLL